MDKYTLKQICDVLDSMIDHPQLKSVIDMKMLGDEGVKHQESPYLSYDLETGILSSRLSYDFVLQVLTGVEETLSDVREAQGDCAQIINDIVVSLDDLGLYEQEEGDELVLEPIVDQQNQRYGFQVTLTLHSERQSCNAESN